MSKEKILKKLLKLLGKYENVNLAFSWNGKEWRVEVEKNLVQILRGSTRYVMWNGFLHENVFFPTRYYIRLLQSILTHLSKNQKTLQESNLSKDKEDSGSKTDSPLQEQSEVSPQIANEGAEQSLEQSSIEQAKLKTAQGEDSDSGERAGSEPKSKKLREEPVPCEAGSDRQEGQDPAEAGEKTGGGAGLSIPACPADAPGEVASKERGDLDSLPELEEASEPASTSGEDVSPFQPEDGNSQDQSAGGEFEEVLSPETKKALQDIFRKGKGESESSRSPKYHDGGVFGRLSEVEGYSPSLLRRLRRALSFLVSYEGQEQPGYRWNWGKFLARLKSYQNPAVGTARKQEAGRPAILILPDVSGSCSGFCYETLIVSKYLARLGVMGSEIIVVSHSNGVPLEIQRGKKAEPVQGFSYYDGFEKILEFYKKLISENNIQLVVALGDWDASWLYKGLSESLRVVWLDNYACNYTSPKISKKFKEDFQRQFNEKSQNIIYIHGCKDAVDFATGLEIACKEVR